MADLIELKLSASLDQESVLRIEQEIKKIGKQDKLKLEVDTASMGKSLSDVERQLKGIGKDIPKITLADKSELEAQGAQFRKVGKEAEDSIRGIMNEYEKMDGVKDGSISRQGEVFSANGKELEKFTVKLEENGGAIKKYTHQLVEMEDGTKQWVRTSITGSTDVERGLKKVEASTGKLLGLQKQLNGLELKAAGLDKQGAEYKQVTERVQELKDKQSEYLENVEKMKDSDFTNLRNEYKSLETDIGIALQKEKERKKITTEEYANQMQEAGRGLVALSAPVVALGGAAIKMQIDYESAFAGVRKTVDATEAQFATLSDGIRTLSKELPQSAKGIAGVAEIAGQLGIPQEKLLEFTETMIKLGDSTNMTSEQAADMLARFANITGMDTTEMDKLGSVIVDLGNNFATTETEIVDMSTRLAAAGTEIGMSEAEIMGLSTALSSVGLKAQLGGTAFSKIMINMANASKIGTGKMKELEEATGKTGRELALMSSNDKGAFKALAQDIGMTTSEMDGLIKAGADLEKFGAIAGMSGEEFARAFEEDAMGALASFIDGLGNAEKNGTSALEMLDELGIKEVRLRDALLRAGGAQELFNRAIKTGNEAWEDNTALTNEAEERYKTAASQLQVLKNRIIDAGIELGGTLAPALLEIVEGVVKVTETFAKMPVGVQAAIVKLAAFVTLSGTLMSIGGRFLRGGKSIGKFFASTNSLLKGTTDLVGTTGKKVSLLSGGIKGLGVTSGIAGAAGIAAVALVGYGIVKHIKAVKKERADLDKLLDNAPEVMGNHKEDIKAMEDMAEDFTRLNKLVGENGDMSKMSADEQQRYIDIVKKLKEISPELEVYYDSQGRMIADSRNEIEKLIEAKKEEMALDEEKIRKGFEKRSEKYDKKIESNREKLNKGKAKLATLEAELDKGFSKPNTSSPKIEFGDDEEGKKNRLKWEEKIKKAKTDNLALTKKESDLIKGYLPDLESQVALLGSAHDIMEPFMGGFSEGLKGMLYDDPTNTDGVKAALTTLDQMGEKMQALKDKGQFLSRDEVKEYTSELTGLGMGYDHVAQSVFGMMTQTKEGEVKFDLMNKTMSEGKAISKTTSDALKANFGEVGKDFKGDIQKIDLALIKSIGKTDTYSAAFLASMMTMEEGVNTFATANENQFKKLKLMDVVAPEGLLNTFNETQKASKKMTDSIAADAQEQRDSVKYMYEELGVLTEEQANAEIENINEKEGIRTRAHNDELLRHQRETLSVSEEMRKRLGLTKELLDTEASTVEEKIDIMQTAWAGFTPDEKSFLTEYSGLNEGDENFYQDMAKWLEADPKVLQFLAVGEGFDLILDNIDVLGDEWFNMTPETQIFLAEAVTQGFESVEEFEKNWKGTGNAEEDKRVKAFVLKLLGLKDVEDGTEKANTTFESDPPKDRVYKSVSTGKEDVIQSKLETDGVFNLYPDPLRKYLLQEEGAAEVRAAKGATDNTFFEHKNPTNTYHLKENGAAKTKSSINDLQTRWGKIPDKQTKTFTIRNITEKITKLFNVSGKGDKNTEKRWTGDDSFKGGLAFVGERGRELLVYPNGNHDITGESTELRNLPKGTRIYNNRDTEDILIGKKTPGFAKGTSKADDYKAKVNRYEGVDIQLQKQNTLLKKNNELQQRAVDNLIKKTQLIKHELELEKQNEKILAKKQATQRSERAELEKKLRKQGFNFKGSGDSREISNLNKIKGKSQDVEDMFNRYNELQFNLIPGIEADRMAINTKIELALSNGYEQQKRINNSLRQNNHLLEVNRIMQSRATDDVDKRVILMQEERKLLEEKAQLHRGEAEILRRERKELEAHLKKEGFKVQGSGDAGVITNPEKVKGKVKEVEEALDRFNEIQFELLPNFVVDGMNLQDEINKVKKEIENDIIDSQFVTTDREFSDLKRNTDRLKNLRTSIHVEDGSDRDKQLLDNIIKQEMELSKKAYEASLKYSQQSKNFKSGSDEWYKLTDKANDYLELSEQINRGLEDLRAERLASELKNIEKVMEAEKEAQRELTYLINMLDEEDVKTNEKKLELSKQLLESEVEYNKTMRSNLEDLKEQLQHTSKMTDEWYALTDAVAKYEEELKTSNLEIKKMNEDIISTAREMAKIKNAEKRDVAERYFFEGKTEEEARKTLDDKLKAQQEFIDNEEKLLEVERLLNLIDAEGLVVTHEQNELLQQGGKLERAKLNRLEKQLNIQIEQTKLNNLEKQKTIRQLKKNEDGSFGFEYIVDVKAIREAEKTLLQSKKDLVDWERDYTNEQEEKTFREKQELLKEEEKRLEESLEQQLIAIKEFYDSVLRMNQAFNEQMDGKTALEVWGSALGEIEPALKSLNLSAADLIEELNVASGQYLADIFKTLGVKDKNVADKDYDLNRVLKMLDATSKGDIGDRKGGLTHEEEQDYLKILLKANTLKMEEAEKLLQEQQALMMRQSYGMDEVLLKAFENTFSPEKGTPNNLPREVIIYSSKNTPIPPKLVEPLTNNNSNKASQNFNIDKLEFPNVRDAKEIERAITDLPTFATQWANEK